jgi:glyoxylase-like metal-dependent hydrolase (beta-lactamase superfamily II)
MKVIMNAGGVAVTNSFLVADEKAKQAVIIDAPNDTTEALLEEAARQGWEVVGLWLTHGHFDHLADHAVVTGRFPNAKVVIHELDQPKLEDPEKFLRAFFGRLPFHIPPRKADLLLRGGEKLSVGSLEFEALHTPGHCAGHVAYYCAAEKVVAGGDLIIGGSVGRTDLPDSDEQELFKSIHRIMALPPETRLLPGHGEPRTLAEELRENSTVQWAMEQR